MYWVTEKNETKPLSRLDDLHLVNVYAHVRHYGYAYDDFVLNQIWEEVRRRKLSDEFINGAPYPWFDMVEKVWKKWSFETNTTMTVGQ